MAKLATYYVKAVIRAFGTVYLSTSSSTSAQLNIRQRSINLLTETSYILSEKLIAVLLNLGLTIASNFSYIQRDLYAPRYDFIRHLIILSHFNLRVIPDL
jgi:hypothetical protein